jgi:hypothetical protein
VLFLYAPHDAQSTANIIDRASNLDPGTVPASTVYKTEAIR